MQRVYLSPLPSSLPCPESLILSFFKASGLAVGSVTIKGSNPHRCALVEVGDVNLAVRCLNGGEMGGVRVKVTKERKQNKDKHQGQPKEGKRWGVQGGAKVRECEWRRGDERAPNRVDEGGRASVEH